MTFNNDSKTRCDPVTGKEDSLDLVIGNLHAARLLKEFWVGYDVGSDHFPVHATLQFKDKSSLPPLQKRCAAKMNMTKWNKLLNENSAIPRAQDAAEIEKNAMEITRRIKDAFERSCPITTIRKRPKCSFTPEIEARVKEKRRLRREKNNALSDQNPQLARQIMSRMNRLGNEIKRLQKSEKKRELEYHCQKLNKETNSKKFFETFDFIAKPIQDHDNPSQLPRPLEDEMKNRAETSQEKAVLFANRLQRVHREPDFKGFDEKWKKSVEAFIDQNTKIFEVEENVAYEEEEYGDDSVLCQKVSLEELEACLAKCKNQSAVGHDGISYFLIKRLPKGTKSTLCEIYSSALHVGYFPKYWKTAHVKMMPKPNKDKKFAKSYRPISLLSCIGKVLERIIATRLSRYMEEKGLFAKSQSGFRRHHMTTEQLLRLSEESHIAFKKKQTVAALFLDAEAAFDKCWHKGICYKLKANLDLPNRTIRLLTSFLSDRTLQVIHDGCYSHIVPLQAGTPQGSPLSPLIYLIYVNDYPESIKDTCSLSQFADDTAMWTAAYTRSYAIRILQKGLNELESWCRKWRVKLNGEKSSLIFISRNWEKNNENYALHLFDDVIRPGKSARFLGIEIDNYLSFGKHIDTIQSRAAKRMNVLKVLARNGVQPKTLIRLYKIYVRPITEYGSAAFLAISSHQFDRLIQIENEAIRISLKLPRYLRRDLLHEYASMQPIRDRLLMLNSSLIARMKTHNSHVNNLCQNNSSHTDLCPKSPIDIVLSYLKRK